MNINISTYTQKINATIRHYLTSSREKSRIKREQEIRDSFAIKERGGKVFIMCCDVAIKVVPSNLPVSKLVEMIDKARMDSLQYEQK